jgi:hypothetical protein
VTAPDGAISTTTYSGLATTTADPAGKTRRATKDGLGRLTLVEEDPFGLDYKTTYAYDALDDLITVVQGTADPNNSSPQLVPARYSG